MKISGKMFGYFRDSVKFLLIISIFLTISIFWYINQQRDYFQQYVEHATELRILTQAIANYANEAVIGQQETVFRSLRVSDAKINEVLSVLDNGIMQGQTVMLPPSPDKIKSEEIRRFSEVWKTVQEKVAVITMNQESIVGLQKTSNRLIQSCTKIQDLYWDIIKIGGAGPIEGKTLIQLAHQVDAAESIVDDMQAIAVIMNDTKALRKSFSDKVQSLLNDAQVLQSENKNVALTDKFNEISDYLKLVQSNGESIVNLNPIIEQAHVAILAISGISPLVSILSKNVEAAYVDYPKKNAEPEFLAYGLGLLSFVVLILSIYLFHKESEYHLSMIEEKNQLMQREVEKLLKELPEIASGNTSLDVVSTTQGSGLMVAESFTYALDTLRKLVYEIGKTAQNVSLAALDAQKITQELAASSGQQAQEIADVSASVSAMTISIEAVSQNAAASAAVALESVNIAGEGGKVVRSTIVGMERIQTHIQETSNYMRRLSDSSQEIGEIVSLIDGIADQTNILSLNASIQAAMAGDAGRGFAVVADEVQRLAEKVSYATKEIGSLVRSIQTDTTQVLGAMEQTRAQVLEGVNSAQAAGSTLEKIETVSRRLSDLIQNISVSASEQAITSGRISQIMNDVKDIAKKTAYGNLETVGLIGRLMQFVTDLKNSVFELKLPKDTNQK